MKFRAHETFAMRKGWLAKGLRYVNAMSNVFVAKDKNPMDTLGIGSAMVTSFCHADTSFHGVMQGVYKQNEI